MNEKIDISLKDKMSEKSSKLVTHINHPSDVVILVEKKLDFFQDVIQKTILHVQKNKMLDILGTTDVNNCLSSLHLLSDKIIKLTESMNENTADLVIHNLQIIINELSGLLKIYGTESLEDLLLICFGNNNISINTEEELLKYNLLKKYFHPTSYKIANVKSNEKEDDIVEEKVDKDQKGEKGEKKDKNTIKQVINKIEKDKEKEKEKNKNISNDLLADKIQNMDSSDISLHSKQFHLKVYGIKLNIYGNNLKTHLIIYGIVDDIIISFLNNKYINSKKKEIKDNIPKTEEFNDEIFDKFVNSLILKDYIVNTHSEVYNKYIGYLAQHKIFKQKTLSQVVKDFINAELFLKRNMLIQLLINSNNYENKYMAYLLYDILSNDTNGSIDTQEQVILFDSLPWTIKQCFREAMKKTIQYTNELSNFDINKIPIEQQICLLKAPDSVKEKAMIKLKEIKGKSDDLGSKARQYLDGLLKIPFNSYAKEPIMNLMDNNRLYFTELKKILNNEINNKSKYTSIEIIKHVKMFKNSGIIDTAQTMLNNIKSHLLSSANNNKIQLTAHIKKINTIVVSKKIKGLNKILYSNKSISVLQTNICELLDLCYSTYKSISILPDIHKLFFPTTTTQPEQIITPTINPLALEKIDKIETNFTEITDYILNVKTTLDDAVYGHEKAKKQIERIICQWINGEQDGYCFGFEGPPGVGKTSLAKRGLSNCLKDELGNSRPYAMVAMGGDSNGSTLHGHNYTYVGSTWGSIVQILIDKKCMNPIIFIDELDKISKTEHGREIVGILTHLLDPTQNDSFQDKYFSGIDLDLSKALFILSYNDVESIDKILLDRIHRIKFNNLSQEDKLIISKTHMLPDIYKKMGLSEMIHFEDDVLKFIIDDFTSEAGVRKLKEILFEIVGEINIDILKNKNYDYDYPINITINDIKTKYFKDKHEIKNKKIPTNSSVGIINGLWANSMGKGGVIPIQVMFYPCDKFLELKLTGMQGDVMKESMNVALTLAWTLTNIEVQNEIREKYNKEQKYGIHIHCPEGAVPKDGPSAGGAITSAIYSLLNGVKIKHIIAMTGEISLDGNITEIGGLDLKFLGGIKAGVISFIYPTENKKDYETFMEKYQNTDLVKGITFNAVSHIKQVFPFIME